MAVLSPCVSLGGGGALPDLRQVIVLLLILSRGATAFSLKDCEVHRSHGPQMKILCYQAGLAHVPSWLPDKVTNLDISRNRISGLVQSDFHNMTQLQVLNVSQNKIWSIESSTFSNQIHLEFLNLSANQLTNLTTSMLAGLGNLSTLLVSDNRIAMIEPGTFAGLEKLQMINLASNNLHTLDTMSPVFQIPSLTRLHIGDNGLHHFFTTDVTETYMNITELDFSMNPISQINVSTVAFQSLQSLNSSFIGGNRLVTFSLQDPCFLKALKSLYLGGINMKPPELLKLIQGLTCSSLEMIQLSSLNLSDSDNLVEQVCSAHPKLRVLQLQDNKFTELKNDTFENCTVIQHLDLSMNNFQKVNKLYFQHLNLLQELRLASNHLLTVSDDILLLGSLQMLDLSYNNIQYIFFNHSSTRNNLTHLNLFSNHLITIESLSQFQALNRILDLKLGRNLLLDISVPFSPALKMLKNLEVTKNKLTSIKRHTFIHLSSLYTLNLVANQIETIEPGAFEGLTNLETLLLGSNNIASPLLEKNIFVGLPSLKELQLFSNGISYSSLRPLAKPPFLYLKSLRILTINSQGNLGMQNLPVNFFAGLVSLEKIHAGNIALQSLDPGTFSFTPNLKELTLSNNPLTDIDPAMLKFVPNLTELHVQKIGLESLDFLLHANLSKLSLFRASGNQLQIVNVTLPHILPSLTFLDLRQNPFLCGCDNSDFLNWTINNEQIQVIQFYTYSCSYPPASKGLQLFKFETGLCKVDLDFILFVCTSVGTLLLMLACTFYHMCRWHVVYAYYFLLAFLYDRKQKQRAPQRYLYDAFVSYSRHDEEWVIHQLLPCLEEQYQWKLCLHHRDFEPGKLILDNIVESIYASRKTICVISQHYLESEWCSGELQVASFRLFDERQDVLVLIFLEEIPSDRLSPYHRMRQLVKKKTYIRWPQKQEEIPLFWQKVDMALKTKEGREEENPILRVDRPEED